jgi:hypothetical protein
MASKDDVPLHGHTLSSALALPESELTAYIDVLLDENAAVLDPTTMDGAAGRRVQLNLARLQQLYKAQAQGS